MNVLEILEYEHQLILGVLWVMQARVPAIEADRPIANESEVVDFCARFIGECHCAKEFELFVRLLQKTQSSIFIGPVTSFHTEHDQLCQQTSALTVAWKLKTTRKPGAGQMVAEHLNAYTNLMRALIKKENYFYEIVGSVLDDADQLELKGAFDKRDDEVLGTGGHDHYCRWAHEFTAAHHELRECSIPQYYRQSAQVEGNLIKIL